MYFSMQWVMQVFSLLEMEDPGLGRHFSKQFSLIFYRRSRLVMRSTGYEDGQ